MAELKKTLGYGTIIALSITSILGTGIFIGPAIAAQYSGAASIFAWIILSVIAIYVAACFGELSSMFPAAGGVYEYAKRTYGHFPSFMIGWIAWLVTNITTCLMIVAAIAYLTPLLLALAKYALAEPLLSNVLAFIPTKAFDLIFAALIIVIFNYIAYRGLEGSSWLLVFFAIVTVGVVLAIIVPGAYYTEIGNFERIFDIKPVMIFVSLFFIMETFFGWESVTFLAEETKNAERVIPFSLLISTVIVCLLGLAVAAVMLGNMPAEVLAGRTAPFEDLAARFYPGNITLLISVGIVLTLLGSAAGCVVSSPRLLLALARDKLFLNQLADIHPRFQTPYKAIIFQTAVTILVVVIGFGAYSKILSFLVPLALMMYIAVLLAVPMLRLMHPDMKRPFRAPFGKVGPVIIALAYAATILAWLLNADGSWQLFKLVLSFILFGMPIYLLLLFHYDPDVIIKLNDGLAYFSLFFERLLVPKAIMRSIFSHLNLISGSKVLEFGCGVGTVTTELVRRVGPEGRIYATDISYRSVQIAEKRVEKIGYRNVHFIHDIHQVNRVHHQIPNVDCMVSVGMLGYIQDIRKVLAEMSQILPEGGRIIFVDYIDLFKILPNVSWLSHHGELTSLFRECGFSVRVEKVRGVLWNYVVIYGIKSKEQVPFV